MLQVGRIPGRLLQGLAHHLGHVVVADPPWSARPRLVIKSVKTPPGETLPPLSNRQVGRPETIGDGQIGQSVGCQQHDARTPGKALPDLVGAQKIFQLFPFNL